MVLAKDQYSTSGWLLNFMLLMSSPSAWQFSQFSLHLSVHLSRPYLISWPTGMLQETVQKPSQNKNVNYAEPVDTWQHFRACITMLSPQRFNVVLKVNSLQFHYAEHRVHCFPSSLPAYSLLHCGLSSPFPGASVQGSQMAGKATFTSEKKLEL